MNLKSGFTLIEILVALLAASIISVMSFEFLSNTVFLKENVNKIGGEVFVQSKVGSGTVFIIKINENKG